MRKVSNDEYRPIPEVLPRTAPWGYKIAEKWRYPFVIVVEYGVWVEEPNYGYNELFHQGSQERFGSGGHHSFLCFMGAIIYDWDVFEWTT